MPYPSYNPRDQFFISGGAGDHGIQAWADAWAIQVGSSFVHAAGYYLGVRARDLSLDTVPAGQFSQLIRFKDGKRFSGPGIGSAPAPNHFWTNMMAQFGADPNASGISMWATFWPIGIGADHVPPPSNTWPDGSLAATGAPSDSVGALIIAVNCNGAPGDGAAYEAIVPAKVSALFQQQWKLDFTLATSGKCGGGIDPIPPPPTPVVSPAGIDVLAWKDGYHIAQAGSGGLHVAGRWHPQTGAGAGVPIPSASVDTNPDCWEPRLAHPEHGPPLSVLYRRDTKNTGGSLFRAESYDYGKTWLADPKAGQAYMPSGARGLKHGVEVWNGRTGERVTIYNDQSATDAQGKVTGKGAIKADVYGPDIDTGTGFLKKHETYPVTEAGVLADDSSFGAIWIAETGAIDCVVMIGGSAQTYQSHDDARSWKRV